MRYYELFEAPIADFGVVGDLESPVMQRVWQKGDSKLLQSDKAIKKIHNAFAKTPYNFNLYIIITDTPNITLGVSENDRGKLIKTIEAHTKKPVITEGNITVVYTQNVTGANARPMNAWTLAHRIGHAVQIEENYYQTEVMTEFLNLCSKITGDEYPFKKGILGIEFTNVSFGAPARLRTVAMDLLSTKSGRDKTLNNVDIELFCEFIAQYLITGKVKLNRAYPEKEKEIAEAEANINIALTGMFDAMVGRIVNF